MIEPEKLGKYEIIATLGRGAMGIVYKGFDPHIERTVAIKTIRRDILDQEEVDSILARFKREAQAAGRLSHPNIVTVYEYGEEGETAFIAMEYVEGRELKEIIENNERFTLAGIIGIMNQLLEALTYSHRQGIVHRDIKPANIILVADGRIKVTDFGIAHMDSSSLTQFGDILGTPSYMSPEQFVGDVIDSRTDIFSAGVVLYHLLTGEKPFPGQAMTTIMHRVMNSHPIKPSELNFKVPSVLDQFVIKALAKNPANRYQTAEEFAHALKSIDPEKNQATVSVSTSFVDNEATIHSSVDPEATILDPQDNPTEHPGLKSRTAGFQYDKKLVPIAGITGLLLLVLLLFLVFGGENNADKTVKDTGRKEGQQIESVKKLIRPVKTKTTPPAQVAKTVKKTDTKASDGVNIVSKPFTEKDSGRRTSAATVISSPEKPNEISSVFSREVLSTPTGGGRKGRIIRKTYIDREDNQ